jgi:hypothetical protein
MLGKPGKPCQATPPAGIQANARLERLPIPHEKSRPDGSIARNARNPPWGVRPSCFADSPARARLLRGVTHRSAKLRRAPRPLLDPSRQGVPRACFSIERCLRTWRIPRCVGPLKLSLRKGQRSSRGPVLRARLRARGLHDLLNERRSARLAAPHFPRRRTDLKHRRTITGASRASLRLCARSCSRGRCAARSGRVRTQHRRAAAPQNSGTEHPALRAQGWPVFALTE